VYVRLVLARALYSGGQSPGSAVAEPTEIVAEVVLVTAVAGAAVAVTASTAVAAGLVECPRGLVPDLLDLEGGDRHRT
jgi:hypothetical protein